MEGAVNELVVDKFWADDLSILFRKDRILEFFVTQDQSTSEKLNSVARFGIYASILLAMYHSDLKYLTLSILTFFITYVVYENTEKVENMENVGSCKKVNKKVTFGDLPVFKEDEELTKPTINNPFGNNSVLDIIDNPERPPMVKYGEHNEKSLDVKQDIEEKFNYNLYKDLGDLYGKTSSQRQFYTTPSRGSIPPDPNGDFKNWLYGKMPSCKDNIFECGKTIHEDPRRKRPVFPNQLDNPEITEAKKSID